tara:strand:- start:1106 stop:1618 length:513 start_codon:yes stop_codon:yes gene_type:complete
MTFSQWLIKEHNGLLSLVGDMVRDPDEQGDLYGCIIEQLLKKKNKLDHIPDKEKRYYFIRVMKNNYNSKTSPYHYQYRKPTLNHIPLLETITESLTDEPYEETLPDMIWVEKTLNENFDWYSRDLFKLWVELGSLTNVSKQTQIPLNSVGRHINNIKTKLKELWQSEHQY